MTCNSFTSVSLEPVLVLFCAEKVARFHDAVLPPGRGRCRCSRRARRACRATSPLRGRDLEGQFDRLPHTLGPRHRRRRARRGDRRAGVPHRLDDRRRRPHGRHRRGARARRARTPSATRCSTTRAATAPSATDRPPLDPRRPAPSYRSPLLALAPRPAARSVPPSSPCWRSASRSPAPGTRSRAARPCGPSSSAGCPARRPRAPRRPPSTPSRPRRSRWWPTARCSSSTRPPRAWSSTREATVDEALDVGFARPAAGAGRRRPRGRPGPGGRRAGADRRAHGARARASTASRARARSASRRRPSRCPSAPVTGRALDVDGAADAVVEAYLVAARRGARRSSEVATTEEDVQEALERDRRAGRRRADHRRRRGRRRSSSSRSTWRPPLTRRRSVEGELAPELDGAVAARAARPGGSSPSATPPVDATFDVSSAARPSSCRRSRAARSRPTTCAPRCCRC